MALKELNSFSSYIMKRSNQSIQLSIINPVYNREEPIKVCLENLRNSTYNNAYFEVIIIDDCSEDETFDVLLTYIDYFPNISVLHNKTNSGGASAPRNKGIEIASGEWVLFLDSDDHLTPNAISDAMEIAKENPRTSIICMPYSREEGSKRAVSKSAFTYHQTVTDVQFSQTKLYNSLNAVGKLFKRRLIEKYEIDFPERIKVREDNWFMMKIYSVSDNISILGNQKDYYFIGEKDEVSLSREETPPRDAVKIYISVYDFIQSLTMSDDKRQEYLALYLNRYTNMIKRGKHAPIRFFEHTKETLKILLTNPLLSENAKNFIEDLFNGKYNVTENK